MSKVDLEAVRYVRELERAGVVFCQDCGETEPKGGFYPVSIDGPTSLSPYLCNACERGAREQRG